MNQDWISFHALKMRAQRIGVTLTELATDAGLAKSTPTLWDDEASNAKRGSYLALQKALVKRELSLLSHLRALDLPEAEQGEVAA